MKNDWEIEDALGAGPDRHPLHGQADPRHQGACAQRTAQRIVSGIEAVKALEAPAQEPAIPRRRSFDAHKADLGFGLLLKKYVTDVRSGHARGDRPGRGRHRAARCPMFWSFRLMVGLGFAFFAAVRAVLLV